MLHPVLPVWVPGGGHGSWVPNGTHCHQCSHQPLHERQMFKMIFLKLSLGNLCIFNKGLNFTKPRVFTLPCPSLSSSLFQPSWAVPSCIGCQTTAGKRSPRGFMGWASAPSSSFPQYFTLCRGRRATWGTVDGTLVHQIRIADSGSLRYQHVSVRLRLQSR